MNSNCPGPHSSSIERGGRPTSQSAVAERLERVADAVEARVGQELVAALDDVDLGRRAGLARSLVERDPALVDERVT